MPDYSNSVKTPFSQKNDVFARYCSTRDFTTAISSFSRYFCFVDIVLIIIYIVA